MPALKLAAVAAALCLVPLAAGAAQRAPAAPADPGLCKETEKSEINPDIFGFSSGTDVASFRSVGLGVEYSGAFETRSGRFADNGVKASVAIGLLPCVEVGPSVFGSRDLFKSFDALESTSTEMLGGGVEIKLKLLGRAQHGIGLTLVAEPTYARARERSHTFEDDGTGTLVETVGHRRFHEWGLASKILVDATLVPDRVFLALNLAHEASWPDVTPSDDSSTLTASAAVSVRLTEAFYLGVEGRYLKAYADAWFERAQGDAWFLGPTFLWAISENIVLSGTWSTQVSGNAKADPTTGEPNPGRLNLVDFNHHEAKLKVGIGF